jgi:hypothetical protein
VTSGTENRLTKSVLRFPTQRLDALHRISYNDVSPNERQTMNLDKEIWEGWTVSDFIGELEPLFDMIQSNGSWQKPFTTKAEVKAWCMDNQPSYKKHIPDVVNYLWGKTCN